jgi:hypothetical protein
MIRRQLPSHLGRVVMILQTLLLAAILSAGDGVAAPSSQPGSAALAGPPSDSEMGNRILPEVGWSLQPAADPDPEDPNSAGWEALAGLSDDVRRDAYQDRFPYIAGIFRRTILDDSPLTRYYDPFSNQFAFGRRGHQPFRLGWYSSDDTSYAPPSAVHGAAGTFQVTDWNSSSRYSRGIGDRYIIAWTPAWNTKFWSGPANLSLPGQVDEIVSDVQLSSVKSSGWNWQLGFTPQINSDFKHTLNSSAYMYDGRAVLLYQTSPSWRWAIGAAYWNRVENRFIPYGGVTWTPDDRWEFRMFFPKARISRYMGTFRGRDVWAYATSEYNVQAYQIDMPDSRLKERCEFRNHQLLVGISAQRNGFTAFTEGGLVAARHVGFRGPTQGFGISDALMARAGILY